MLRRCICFAQINSFCCCNCFQFISQSYTNGFHMLTVLITSNSCSQNCLRQIVTHVQTEFAPHFLTDIFRTAEMNSCFRKQLLHRTNSSTFIGHFQLSENNPNSRFRVKAISIPFFMRCHFNQRIQDMGLTYFLCNPLFAVYTVHQTHHCRMFPDNRLNVI